MENKELLWLIEEKKREVAMGKLKTAILASVGVVQVVILILLLSQ